MRPGLKCDLDCRVPAEQFTMCRYLTGMNKHSFLIPGSEGRGMVADLFLPHTSEPAPLLIYAHGFNGFKDWGGADLIAEAALERGFAWLRFNFTHNGTTPEHPEEFVDLKAFGSNTYSKELYDLRAVMDWVQAAENPYTGSFDAGRCGLIGHSKGGAEVIVFAAEDGRVKALATWAAVSACRTPWDNWDDARMAEWQEAGRTHILNGRTQQQMPLDYSLVEDYDTNRERFNVIAAASRLQIPWLICHGTADTSVDVSHARRLHAANQQSVLFTTETDHVFGRKHPWTEASLPGPTVQVLQRTFDFFKIDL
jgi:dienelactone hydrolase